MGKWNAERDIAIWTGTSTHLTTEPGWHTPGAYFCGYFHTHNEALIASYKKWLVDGEQPNEEE